MPLVRLAWRNLWRHRRRTLLLMVIVGYAAAVIVFFWGFTDGFLESVLESHGRLLSAPVVITTPAYQDDPDPEHALPDLAFLDAVRRHPLVQAAAVRVAFPALVTSPYASAGTEVRGVDPAAEPGVSRVARHVAAGRMLERPGEAVLGAGLAERLDVRLGERLVVDAASLAGPQAAGLVLVGLVRTGVTAVDDALVWIHQDDARRLSGVATATEVALQVPWGREEAVASSLREVLPPGVGAYGLRERLGSLWEELRTQRVETTVLGLFLSLFAALGVVSTVLISVMQRTREFGMMLAMGMSQRQLARLVVWETVLVGALGWAGGLVVGYALTFALSRVNLVGALLSGAYGQLFAELGLPGEIYTVSRPAYALYASSTVLTAVLFSLAAPVRRVWRLEPARALRSE